MSIVPLTQTSARPITGQPDAPVFALPTQTVGAQTTGQTGDASPPTDVAETGGPSLTTAQHHWGMPKVGAGLFSNDWQRQSLDQINTALGNRFGPVLRATDLTSGLNIGWSDAQRLVQHLGQGGEIALPDFMNHISRFASGWDQSMSRSGFENAMRVGANSLSFGRFEAGPGMGVDVNGFMEMARRAGAQAPDHLLEQAFNRAASSGWHSDRALLDPSEMSRFFGASPDRNGDVNAAALARGIDRAAAPPPPPPPPPQHGWNPWRPPVADNPSPWRPWNPWC